MKSRVRVLLLEALVWFGGSALLGYILTKATDIPVLFVFLVVGAALGLGTIIEIWAPGPLTGKRHPKHPKEGPR